MAPKKINVNLASKPVSLVEQIEAKGISFGKTEDGSFAITLNIPGISPVELTEDDIDRVVDTLCVEVPEGTSPGETFARSASSDSEGNLTARFSDAKRSRSVTVPADEKEAFAHLLTTLQGKFGVFAERWEEASKEKKAEE